MPKTDSSVPTQQLAYITVLPDHSSGNLMTYLSSVQPAAMRVHPDQLFDDIDSMPVTVEKLNHHLQQKPLPGRSAGCREKAVDQIAWHALLKPLPCRSAGCRDN